MSTETDELFELCKEVYEKTGWEDTLQFYRDDEVFAENEYEDYGMAYSFRSGNDTPLYTSDYLLEKLPKKVFGVHSYDLELKPIADDLWIALYCPMGELFQPSDQARKPFKLWSEADTPLKALLKLTLALHEAKELPTKKENK
ncbi:hypothetical protein [Cryobacterium sp. GrIS_2_6]|uniref:hypothetical protein n=1 Tax=Cryobacterium sp. GrIS_2_6 TaxID=3162785 RepID=UPI002E0AD593|nr:hypothetical protein [Cryobacterium psychrotolerans]